MYGDEHYRQYVDIIIDYVEFDMRPFTLLLFGRAYNYMDKETGRILVDTGVLCYECYMSTTMVGIVLDKLVGIGLLRKSLDDGKIAYYINKERIATKKTAVKVVVDPTA